MKTKPTIVDGKYAGADRPVLWIILFIWLCLAIFGLFTMLQPKWLQELSKKGRTEEATTIINEANKILYEANMKGSKELFNSAIRQYIGALKIDTANVDATNNLATAYLYVGEFEKAIALQDKLLGWDTIHQAIVYINKGDLYERMKDEKTALEYYEKACSKNPYDSYPWRKCGLYYYKNGQLDKAIRSLQYSIGVETDFVANYAKAIMISYRYAIIKEEEEDAKLLTAMLNRKDLAKDSVYFDTQMLREANKRSKPIGLSYMYLGDVYSALNDSLNARQSFKMAVKHYAPLEEEIRKRPLGR